MPPIADEADQDLLEIFRENMATVLTVHCDSRAVHAHIDGETQLDRSLWRQAAELGWLGLGLPQSHGGLDMGMRGLAVLFGELGRNMAPGAFIPTLAAAHVLALAGPDTAKQAWLPRIATGEASLAVPATLISSGTGDMTFIGSSDAAAVLATDDDGGWALYELPEGAARAIPGWDRTRDLLSIDLRAAADGVALDARAGEVLLLAMALAVAADSLGGAQRITRDTIDYLKNRQQFGRPLASFQALKHRIADQASRATVNEQLLAHAIALAAIDDPDAVAWAMLAKSEISEGYDLTAADCVQLHGGVGFTSEYDPHIHLKRARLNAMLVASNSGARDMAADRFAAAVHAGRSSMELEQR